jgi:hypothetical protein
LAWRGSRDGFEPKVFHSLCDKKGESVTIIKSKNGGYLFGGYASVSWKSKLLDCQYERAPGSFIFTLYNPHGIPPTKYSLNNANSECAVFHNDAPSFGGMDIEIEANCNTNNNSHAFFPYSYNDTTGKSRETFTGSKYFEVEDIELFTH